VAAELASPRACFLPVERAQDDSSEDEPAQSDCWVDSAGYWLAPARDLSPGDCSAPELQVDDSFPLAELDGLPPGDYSAVPAPADSALAARADSAVPD